MKKTTVLLLFATAACLYAQSELPRMFHLKYADARRLAAVLQPFAGATITWDDQLKTLTINPAPALCRRSNSSLNALTCRRHPSRISMSPST